MGRSTAIGTWAETQVVKASLRAGIKAARQPRKGAKDEGDVWLLDGRIVVEAKAGEQTRKPSWALLDAWWHEALVEAERVYAAVPVLVVRRWGSGKAEDWWAYCSPAFLSNLHPKMHVSALKAQHDEDFDPFADLKPVCVRFGELLDLLAYHYAT